MLLLHSTTLVIEVPQLHASQTKRQIGMLMMYYLPIPARFPAERACPAVLPHSIMTGKAVQVRVACLEGVE